MDWDDLRHLVALARAGSLSAAARRLGAEHTTVARRIASLEADLGVRLFERTPHGYVLTAEGEQIVEPAFRVEEEAFAIERLARSRPTALTGTVRISAPPNFASHFLAERLAGLRVEHPGIDLELIGDSRSVSLSRREADLAIRLNPPTPASIVARKLGIMAFGLYGRRDELSRRPPETWEFLGYDESLDQVPQQRWLRKVAGSRRFVLRTNDLASLQEAAAAGMGMAALPRFLGDADSRLALAPVEAAEAARELWLLVHPDLRRSPRVRTVMDHLVKVIVAARPALDPKARAPDLSSTAQ